MKTKIEKRPFRKNVATDGDSVIACFGKSETQLVKLAANSTTQNKYGALKHNDVIGKPFGSRIGTSKGHVFILALDPVLWTTSLPHRTQIIYTADASLIVGRLDIFPGSRVLEAGTGSGALTHAIAQTVWPNGKVNTFDFHEERVFRARQEFKEHGLEDVISVNHRDVLVDGFPIRGTIQNKDGVDAIMIDLPEPWVVIGRLPHCFAESGGRVCVFSPCIEQVQRNCENLRKAHFVDIETLECVQRTFDFVHTVLNVPNLGQADAGKLMNCNTIQQSLAPVPTTEEFQEAPKQLFPPPAKYITSSQRTKDLKGNKKVCYHQDGSWEAYPRPKGTGHTGYLTFASYLPQPGKNCVEKIDSNT